MQAFLFCFVSALAGLANDAGKDPVPKQLAAFQGDWWLVGLEAAGKTQEFPVGSRTRLTVKGKSVFRQSPDCPQTSEWFVLNVDPSLKLMDLTFHGSDSAEGIYVVDGDIWKMCFNAAAGVKNRPVDFSTSGRPGHVVFVLQRAKD